MFLNLSICHYSGVTKGKGLYSLFVKNICKMALENKFDKNKIFIMTGEHPEEITSSILAKKTADSLKSQGYNAILKKIPFSETAMASYAGKISESGMNHLKKYRKTLYFSSKKIDKDEAKLWCFENDIDELKTGVVFNFHNSDIDSEQMDEGTFEDDFAPLNENSSVYYSGRQSSSHKQKGDLSSVIWTYKKLYNKKSILDRIFDFPLENMEYLDRMQIAIEILAVFKENKNPIYAEYRKYYDCNKKKSNVVDIIESRKRGLFNEKIASDISEGIKGIHERFVKEIGYLCPGCMKKE